MHRSSAPDADLLRPLFEASSRGLCYPFFVHPSTEPFFKDWIGARFPYVAPEASPYLATPTSSFRTLLVTGGSLAEPLFVKVSLLTNLTNGSRHIDWFSALGQWESSELARGLWSEDDRVWPFSDIAALGLRGPKVTLPEHLLIRLGSRTVEHFATVVRRFPQAGGLETPYASLASLTSPLPKDGPALVRFAQAAQQPYGDYLDQAVFHPLWTWVRESFEKQGFIPEPHCQNTMARLAPKGQGISGFAYRDFDRVHLDRLRFPVRHPRFWKAYLTDRPDRHTFEENFDSRFGIAQVFHHHLLNSLMRPCLRAGVWAQALTEAEAADLQSRWLRQIQSQFFTWFPLAEPDYLFNSEGLLPCPETLAEVHRSEIQEAVEGVRPPQKSAQFLPLSDEGQAEEWQRGSSGLYYGLQGDRVVTLACDASPALQG